MRELIEAFNENMVNRSSPGWLSSLDESMVPWTNMKAPGWVFVPRKPSPMGNEYHSIADVASGILFRLELMEGKDARLFPPRQYGEHGKVTGLVMRLCSGIAHTGSAVVMDAGFSVLKALVKLREELGVYACIVVKKRAAWPKYVPADRLLEHLADKPVGDTNALQGTWHNQEFHLVGWKKPDYVFLLMTTFGTLRREGEGQKNHCQQPRFFSSKKRSQTETYPSPPGEPINFPGTGETRAPNIVRTYVEGKGAVDNHNKLRQASHDLTETWRTKKWHVRQFTNIVAMCEINALLAFNHFVRAPAGEPPLGVLAFRRLLARELIDNHFWTMETARADASASVGHIDLMDAHEAMKQPQFRYKWKTTGDPGDPDNWTHANYKYQSRRCKGCVAERKTRLFCKCNPNLPLCDKCLRGHLVKKGKEFVLGETE